MVYILNVYTNNGGIVLNKIVFLLLVVDFCSYLFIIDINRFV